MAGATRSSSSRSEGSGSSRRHARLSVAIQAVRAPSLGDLGFSLRPDEVLLERAGVGSGGSLRAGQELVWASTVRLPILYLRNKGQPMSRQIAGTPADLDTAEFEAPGSLVEAVAAFLRQNRGGSSRTGPAGAGTARPRFTYLGAMIRAAWRGLANHGWEEISGRSRLHRRRIEELAEPIGLSTASLGEVTALTAGLGIDIGRALSPAALPDLDASQLIGHEPLTKRTLSRSPIEGGAHADVEGCA